MLNKKLLDILICPDKHLPLKLAEQELVDRLNGQIDAGTLQNAAGKSLENKLDGGLLREDGRVLYPIVDGIPILLVEEAITLDDIET